MAIKRKGEAAPDAKIPMTSMIDIVFLLIIFFMVVTEMTKMEVIELTLPIATQGQSEEEDPKDRLVVNVAKSGKIIINQVEHPLEQFRALLQARKRQAKQAPVRPGEAPVSELFVKIRADAETEYQYIVEVMAQCAYEGVYRLSFAVNEAPIAGVL